MEFGKYQKKGAYHWIDIGPHPIKSNPCVKARYRKCIDLLRGRLSPNKTFRILDLGCGDGALTYLLWKTGYIAQGSDTSSLGIELARKQHAIFGTNCVFKRCEIDDFEDNYFDGIICSDVIEHVEDPNALISGIFRTLKAGGVAVLSTPIRLTEAPLDKEHAIEWWPSEWRKLFSSYGYVEFCESHPVALMEMVNVPYVRVLINMMSLFMDLFLRKQYWNLFAIQYAVLSKNR